MPYLILAFDNENMDAAREKIREAHRTHLKSVGKKLLGSGALLSDDGDTIIGGMSILDTDNFDEAERFANEDPYAKVGIRNETKIIRWRNRWWDGEFKGDN